MRMPGFLLVLFAVCPMLLLGQDKAAAVHYIEKNQTRFISLSDSIWKFAEPSYKEERSSQVIMDVLQKEGFTITRDIDTMRSVFIAEFGSGKPIIGLYGEYDADANASNKSVPRQEPLTQNGFGHGGHHNLLGVGALAAALTVKELIKEGRIKCTIRYYGSTDEGRAGVRRYLSYDGYFSDLDFSLYWHPSPITSASTRKWDALSELRIDSRNESVLNELNFLKNNSNTEYKLTFNADSANIKVRMQCVTLGLCDTLFNKLSKAAGGKIISTKYIHQFVPNVAAMRAVHKNMEQLGVIQYTEQEKAFVTVLQRSLGKPTDGISYQVLPFTDQSRDRKMYGYSSDIGEASWIAPEAYFVVKTLPFVDMHTWQGTIFSGHSIGHKGMIQAAKILSLTIIDYVKDKELQRAVRADFETMKKFYGGN